MSRTMPAYSRIQLVSSHQLLYRISMRFALAFAAMLLLLLTGCATPVTVEDPSLDLPPVPSKYLQPCQEPSPLARGTMEELYLQMLQDATPWAKCVRDHDQVIAILEYQEAVKAKYRAKLEQQKSGGWFAGWKWPWQK